MKHFQAGQNQGELEGRRQKPVARLEQMQIEYAILLGNLWEGDISVDLGLERGELLRRMLRK
jgi:hypothetical protein